MATPRPSSLLSLPRRLRDLIIEAVLLTPCRELETADFRDSLREGRFVTKFGNRLKLERAPPISPAGPLLLTNRQLNYETRDVIRRREAETNRYVLDVAYLKNCTFWATWLMRPVVRPRVDEIYIQWRILDCPDQLGLVPKMGDGRVRCPRDVMFKSAECSHGARQVEIASSWLIWEVLKAGPKVGRLVFDFLPATDRHILPLGPYWDQKHGFQDFFEIYYNCFSSTEPPKDDPGLRAAAALAGFMADCLECPSPSFWSTAAFRNRVPEIVILLDGKPVDRRTYLGTLQ